MLLILSRWAHQAPRAYLGYRDMRLFFGFDYLDWLDSLSWGFLRRHVSVLSAHQLLKQEGQGRGHNRFFIREKPNLNEAHDGLVDLVLLLELR
jgi:hypothetical protein